MLDKCLALMWHGLGIYFTHAALIVIINGDHRKDSIFWLMVAIGIALWRIDQLQERS